MADRFVKDPHDVVKTGEVVKVKVLDIDLKRKRIALSMRLSDDSREAILPTKKAGSKAGLKRDKKLPLNKNNAMAEALRKAMKG
jgi:uncharacterized protein